MTDLAVYLYLGFIVIGCWIRILAPFIRKNLEGEHLEYDHLYTMLFIVSFLVALVAGATIFLANPLDPDADLTVTLLQALILGFTSQSVVDEVAKWFFPDSWWKRGEA